MLYHSLSKNWGCWPKRGSFQYNHTRQPKSPSAFLESAPYHPHRLQEVIEVTLLFMCRETWEKTKNKTSKQKPSSLPDQEMIYEKWFCTTVDSTCFSLSQSLLLPSQSTCWFPLIWHLSHCRIFVHMTDSHIILSVTRRQVKVAQSCLTLCDSMDYTVHGILQARTLEWVAIPSPGDLPNLGIELRSPALQADSLPAEPPGRP